MLAVRIAVRVATAVTIVPVVEVATLAVALHWQAQRLLVVTTAAAVAVTAAVVAHILQGARHPLPMAAAHNPRRRLHSQQRHRQVAGGW